MTEAEWLACADPQEMLDFLKDKASDRKLRLFACACCRRVWSWLTHEKSRRAVEAAERFADAERRENPDGYFLLQQEVRHVWEDAGANWLPVVRDPPRWASAYSRWAASEAVPPERRAAERGAQADLLRDTFGSPFRPVTLNAAWRTADAVRLAEAAYSERYLPAGRLDLVRLAVLADALEEAGCDNADVLNHCRGTGEHFRGCWVIDLLLGRQ